MNKYVLNARIYPTVITLLPIIVLGLYFSIQYESIYQAIGGLGLTTIFGFLLGQVGRDRGKNMEKKLWESWGGIPSIQILRHSNNVIDKLTKPKLHEKLYKLSKIGEPETSEIEINNPEKADGIYSSWGLFLRTSTRDVKKFPLVFEENINYGFRRNLWGLKIPAIFIALFSVLVIEVNEYMKYHDLLNYSFNAWLPAIALVLILMFWFLYVKRKWVQLAAFSYAQRLIESTHNLD